MRTIFLMRHGDAKPGVPGKIADRERELSEFGREQALAQASWLLAREERIDEIWHSPYIRAIQTARALQEVGGWSLREERALVPSGYVDDWELLFTGLDRVVLVVSHLPIIDSFQEGVTGKFVSFRPATLAKLVLTQEVPLRGELSYSNDARP